MNNKYLLAALLVPVLFLLSLTFKPLMTLQFGETVQLQTQPVDPTDLFRGDYINLFYDMNQLEVKESAILGLPAEYTEETLRGEAIYVLLKPSDIEKVYQVASYAMNPPKEGLYLKGNIRYAYLKGILPSTDDLVLNIDFGIDRYFIEENSGADLESAAQAGKVLVTLKVFKGFGVVTDLELQK